MVRKIKKVFNYGITCCTYISEFNWKVALYSFISYLYHPNNTLGRKFADKKEKAIKNYIYECSRPIQERYKKFDMQGEPILPDSNIWVCWWQGIENAPELVKLCIESIRKNASTHKVVVLTEENYKNYVKLPDYIIEKYRSGKMCSANFADILRISLLAEYGGIWMDATIFMTYPFDNSIYNYLFCSNKRINQPTSLLYPAQGRWGTYFLATGQGNMLFHYVRDVFYDFWKNHDMVIDYGMIDFIIALGYDTNLAIQKIIDESPPLNEHIHYLLPKLNEKFDLEFYEMINKDTNLHKLTYKQKFQKECGIGLTFYGQIYDVIYEGGKTIDD